MLSSCRSKFFPSFANFFFSKRFAQYIVNQNGEKTVVSKRNNVKSKREKWQNVKPMGNEEELRKIKFIEKSERLKCDSKVARITAQSKLQQLRDRLQNAGFCREIKSYNPPSNVKDIIESISLNVFGKIDYKIPIETSQKFKFLIKCNEKFNHEISNSDLHTIKTVEDALKYYSTPVTGINAYNKLAQKPENLPLNLHVIPEPIRFNPETDSFFNGISAFAGSDAPEYTGLRAKKKYPSFNSNFIWPDV